MPFTLNGIGTRYCGSSNRSARVDVCQSCKRSTTLASYDTREFICVLYIPLIPIAKYRILDDCSSCRKHRRLSAKEFTARLDEILAPLREAIKRSPQDPQTHFALVRTLIGWEMRPEAERQLQVAMSLFPRNVDLILLSAQLAIDRNDFAGALRLYERASQLDPQSAPVTYGHGWLLHQMERYQQAIPVLQRSHFQDPGKAGTLYLLGFSYMKCLRWAEAVNIFQQLLALVPAYKDDKKFLRMMRECKQHLGYELTDAERRAGRSWWPFNRKTRRPKLQSGPTLVRPSLRIAGIALLALVIPSLIFVAWDRRSNIEMYFDNGLDRPVKVELDGHTFDLPRKSPRKEVLKEGAHTVVVRETGGKEIERLAFSVEEMSIFDSVMHDRFFVYDVAAQNVYRRATHGYASSRENSTYEQEFIGMKKFFEQRDVDYPFQSPPDTISIDSNSSVEKKVSFNRADDVDLSRYAILRFSQGKKGEAQAAIERAAANAPCDTRTRRMQVQLAGMMGSADEGSEVARQWIADCAADDLEAHRAYQDVNTSRGRRDALRQEYANLLAAAPNSGKAHYLYGRVMDDPAAAAAQYQLAISRDPSLVWPRLALGYAYEQMERHDAALREFSSVLDMKGRDSSAVVSYAMVAIANGTPEAAVTKVEEAQKANPREYAAVDARWLLALAAHDWVTATKMQKILQPIEGREGAWWRNTKLMRMKSDAGVDQEIDRAARDKELRGLAAQMRALRDIEKGEFAETAAAIAQGGEDIAPSTAALLQAYAAGGLLLQGNAPLAKTMLDSADKALAAEGNTPGKRLAAAVVGGLRGSTSVNAVMAVARENNAMAHGWFVAAVRAAIAQDRARAAECLAHCARAASDLEFPYLEAKAMAANVSRRVATASPGVISHSHQAAATRASVTSEQ